MFPAVLAFFANPMVKRFLPWIAVALGVVTLAWVAHDRVEAFKSELIEQGRVKGRGEMTDIYRNTIAENNRKNRQLDSEIQAGVEKFKKDFDKKQQARLIKEEKAKDAIEKQIVERPQFYTNPSCTLPQEMIDTRNSIRALGPK